MLSLSLSLSELRAQCPYAPATICLTGLDEDSNPNDNDDFVNDDHEMVLVFGVVDVEEMENIRAINFKIQLNPNPPLVTFNQAKTKATLNPILELIPWVEVVFGSNTISIQGFTTTSPADLSGLTYLIKVYYTASAGSCLTHTISGEYRYVDQTGPPCMADVGTGCQDLEACFPAAYITGVVQKHGSSCINSINSGLPDAAMEVYPLPGLTPLLSSTLTDDKGNYVSGPVTPEEEYRVVPSKWDYPFCGVTSADVYDIFNKDLGVGGCWTEPWKAIAADVVPDGNLTISDVLAAQQLANQTIPSWTIYYWRFVSTGTYSGYENPGCHIDAPSFNEWLDVEPGYYNQADFWGIKVGDVDGTCTECSDQFAPGDPQVESRSATSVGDEIVTFADNQEIFPGEYRQRIYMPNGEDLELFFLALESEMPFRVKEFRSTQHHDTELTNIIQTSDQMVGLWWLDQGSADKVQNIEGLEFDLVYEAAQPVVFGLNKHPGAPGAYRNGGYYTWKSIIKTDLSREQQIQIWPNPTDGVVWINSDQPLGSGILTIRDIHGRSVYIHQLAGDSRLNEELDLTFLSKGMYLCEIRTSVMAETLLLNLR
ncbi:MAG: T9SS type A sorting domain-containing protein [Saprospiraceae bacterium]|nr:T9SS type A sorting domain-containing protein [Saprospiraceae bacterium]